MKDGIFPIEPVSDEGVFKDGEVKVLDYRIPEKPKSVDPSNPQPQKPWTDNCGHITKLPGASWKP
jgi:hypothetical protein